MKFLSKEKINNKRVIVRCDFNVPIKNGVILDNSKILKSLKTIKYLLDNNNQLILLSHFGRVKSVEDFDKNSLLPVYEELKKHIEVVFSDNPKDIDVDILKNKCILLENTRFNDIPEKTESNNDLELAKYYSSLADVFVFDAFGTSHRLHSSTAGISNFLPTYIGFLVEEEIKKLEILFKDNAGLVAIMGGAKVDDKISVIKSLILKCDKIILTGGILNSFLKQKGFNTGKSLISENEEVNKSIIELLENYSDKFLFSDKFVTEDNKTISISEMNDNDKICDNVIITNDTLKNAKTIFINGTPGMYEDSFDLGTKSLFEILVSCNADVIVGGGDTASAALKYASEKDFYYISSGGGATLEYIADNKIKVFEYFKSNK